MVITLVYSCYINSKPRQTDGNAVLVLSGCINVHTNYFAVLQLNIIRLHCVTKVIVITGYCVSFLFLVSSCVEEYYQKICGST